MNDWWLTATADGQQLCWHLGKADDDQREELITRVRALLDLPVTDVVHLHAGPPHHKLLALCTMRDRAELAAVDPAAVDAYRARVDEETARQRQADARELLLRMTPEDRAELIAELPTRSTGGASR